MNADSATSRNFNSLYCTANLRKAIALVGFLGFVLSLQGCGYTGMQLGVHASGNDNSSGLLSDDVSARADVYAINAQTINRLKLLESAGGGEARKKLNVLAEEREYQYRVGPQDVLRITIWEHPELNNPSGASSPDVSGRVVNDDGTLFYPYVGVLQVNGKSVQEIRSFIEKVILKVIRDPQVDVSVQSYRSQRVLLSGEVKTPGVQPITDVPLRIADAILASGGVTGEADLSAVTLYRDGKTYNIDLYSLIYSGDVSQNYLLRNGDSLNIPERRRNKVFVLGEISRPTSLLMPRGGYSLTEALGDSGGVSQITANAGQIYVIRSSEKQQRPEIYHLNSAAPDALILADNFQLHPRDVIYVDAATVTRVGRVISQILPSAQVLQSAKASGF